MRSLTSTASLAFLLGIGALAAAPTASQAYIGIGINVGFAPPALALLRTASDPRLRVYLDAWLLGMGPRFSRLLLGARNLDPSAPYRLSVDPWLLGLARWFLCLQCRILGPHIGFYGGVNYGFGYNGFGYGGGEWRGNNFFYNRSVNNVRNVNITNVYDRTVVNNNSNNRVSFNGGNGGVRAQPTPEQAAAAHEQHVGVTPAQQQHFQAARMQPNLRASVNHGAPPVAATPRPAAFSGAGVVPARGGGNYRAPNPAAQAGRPGGPGGYGPRPNEGQGSRPYAPNASENRPSPYRPAVANEGGYRPGPQGPRPQAQAPRPQFQAPRPQAQAPRPQPQAMRPPPPGPAPQQHAAPAPREEHPHDEHH